jgi:hypothetical protein
LVWWHTRRQRGGGEVGRGMQHTLCEVVFGVPVMKCYKFSMREGGGGAHESRLRSVPLMM